MKYAYRILGSGRRRERGGAGEKESEGDEGREQERERGREGARRKSGEREGREERQRERERFCAAGRPWSRAATSSTQVRRVDPPAHPRARTRSP